MFSKENLRHLTSRKLRYCAAKTTLLVLTSSLSTALHLSPALAQPTTSPPTPADTRGFKLPTEQRELFRKYVDVSTMETICAKQLSLKVSNATLQDVIAKIKTGLPPKTRIEVIAPRPIRVSFDLKETTVGNALQSVSVLAGCKLWVFADYLLIAPELSLNAAEKTDVEDQDGGEWLRNLGAGGTGWSAQSKGLSALLEAMADVFDQKRGVANAAGNQAGELSVNFGELSPDGQAILAQLVEWNMQNSRQNPNFQPLILAPNTKVTFKESDNKHVSIQVRPQADSNQRPPMAGWGFSRD